MALALFKKKEGEGKESSRDKKEKKKLSKISGQYKQKVKKSAPVMVGIDIGSVEIKVAAGQYRNGEIQVKKVCGAALPERAVADEKIVREQEVGMVIKNLLRENKIKEKKAACAMESTLVLRREITVPAVGKDDLPNIIGYEIGQYMPVDIASYILQYKVTSVENGKLKVNVCAMPRDIALQYQSMVKSAKLQPLSFDLHTNGLEKLIYLEDIKAKGFMDKNLMFIDMGHNQFNISFFSKGHCLFSKKLELGGYMLDQVFFTNLDVGAKKVEELKIRNLTRLGIPEISKCYYHLTMQEDKNSDQEDIILMEIMRVVDKWAEEIGDVLQYLLSREESSHIDKVYLYGGCSKIKELDAYLSTRLNIEISSLTGLSCLKQNKKVASDAFITYLNAICALIRF